MTLTSTIRTPILIILLALAACTTTDQQVAEPATATLAPIVSMTPRYTATPVPSKTPLPTFTYTPSESPVPPTPSDTPRPTEVPPVIGIVTSLQTVNVREGPGGSFRAFEALTPGTGVEIIGQNEPGTWFNVELEDGRQGWIFAELVRIQPSPTPFPTMTPTPDLTRLFLGTPLPTALLGGGTVTPTPPRSVVTPEQVTVAPRTPTVAVTSTPQGPPVPVIDINAINMTATALVGGVSVPTTPSVTSAAATSSSPGVSATPRPQATGSGASSVQDRVNVLAVCDDSSQGVPAPTDLAAGSTIVVWWSWFATTEDQVRDHIESATYEVRVDGTLLTNLNQYRTSINERDKDHVVSWFVPYLTPLTAGEHRITYRVTWSRPVYDGFKNYGPGTNTPVEEGSCTFTVR